MYHISLRLKKSRISRGACRNSMVPHSSVLGLNCPLTSDTSSAFSNIWRSSTTALLFFWSSSIFPRLLVFVHSVCSLKFTNCIPVNATYQRLETRIAMQLHAIRSTNPCDTCSVLVQKNEIPAITKSSGMLGIKCTLSGLKLYLDIFLKQRPLAYTRFDVCTTL